MSVLSHSNVQILWEVLNGLISDNKLKISNMDNFRGYFDNKCKEYHVRRFDYNGLSDINKHIVSECFEYLRKASQDSKLVMFREFEEYGNKNIIKNLQVGKRYEEHQNNFKSMINAKKPNEIEFSDIIDEPIGDMEDAMSKRMEERNADINNITDKYNQNHDSIKWLNNSGDIPPKLKIHNDESVNDNRDNRDNKDNKDNKDNNDNKDKKDNKVKKDKKDNKVKKEKKKVKFKSDFLDNMNNFKNAELNEDKKNEDKKNEDLKEKASIFQNMTEELNNQREKNSRIYLEKREIISIMDEKDKDENKKVENNTNIMDVFSKMKKKTDVSDVNGAQNIDLIDINRKIDKIEHYIVDVLKNQIDLMDQQKEILSKIQFNLMVENNEPVSSFSAI